MTHAQGQRLLDALLDSWDRNNVILVNLLKTLPEGGLTIRAMEGSPSVSEMFTHMHHERMISVLEEAPELAGTVPEREWAEELDPRRIEAMLDESARFVRNAIQAKVETGQEMNLNFDHPILLLQLLIFHEGYHHGQIKLALKLAGRPVADDQAGPLTWDFWRRRR